MTKHERYYAIDRLRALMIMAVMLGHGLLPYVTVPRSFKDPSTHIGFDAAAIFIYSFAMQVFFVTAGFAAALLLDRRGVAGLIHNRIIRIFVPLLLAYLVLSPVTRCAYDFAKAAAATGSIQAGIDVVLAGGWIRWSKTYHLWFLVSLLIFSGLTLGLRWSALRFAPQFANRVLELSRVLLRSPWRAVPLASLIASATVPAYVVHAGESTTVFLQLSLLVFFVLGWLIYLQRELLPLLRGHAGRYLAIVLLALPLASWSTRLRLIAPEEPQLLVGLVAGLSNSVLGACMTFALLGWSLTRTDRQSGVGRYLSDASYWIYLVHLPLIVAAGGALSVTSFPALIKYLLTVAIVVPIVLFTYHFGVRRPSFQ